MQPGTAPPARCRWRVPVDVAAVLGAALLVGACATPAPPRPAALDGTAWQLVSFRSMDDAQPTLRPQASQRFTLEFGADGRATFQLDCNRATGTWQATPAAGGDGSGSLTFGPLAMTRAQCPPPSLDQRLAALLPYVRGYLLRDGQLHLSLLADAGILSWVSAP